MARMKTCGRCRQTKQLEEFPPMKSGKDGRYSYCRPCHADYQSARHPNRAEIDLRKSLKSQGLKRCTRCKEIRLLEDFYWDEKRQTAGHCKPCLRNKYRVSYLMSEYGLTPEQFEALLDHQGGACAICRRAFGSRVRTNIDHCHRTHEVRSILCVNCNTKVLPIVEHQRDTVEAALVYLDCPPARSLLGAHQVPVTNQARRRSRR